MPPFLLAQMLFVQAQQQVEPIPGGDTLLQYGAIGFFALALVIAVGVMWRRLIAIADAERQRADRLESELIAVNNRIAGQFSDNLVRATEAIREVSMQRHRDRDRGDQ